jgi:Domain of unknown function (DUF4365)
VVRLPKRPREHVLETESEKFAHRVLPSEWIAERREHDYGIDLQVEIVKNESVTGARFSIQLKSTDGLKVRKKAYIAHPCATSALFYYLQLPEPVIYLVYDAKGDAGYWIWIQEYIRDGLDTNWKNQEEAIVRIPKDNIFDGRAIKQIAERVFSRHDQARWMQAIQTANNPYYRYTLAATDQETIISIFPRYPGADVDSPIQFSGTFKFDQSDEGRTAHDAFDKSIKTGSPVKLASRFFEGFDFSAAHPDLFAHVNEFRLETIELQPIASNQTNIAKLLFLDSHGSVSHEIPYIEFREVQSGIEEITYSNEHQDTVFKLTYIVKIAANRVLFNLRCSFDKQNISRVYESLRVYQALKRARYIKVIALATQQSFQLDVPPQSVSDIDAMNITLAEDLLLIQERKNISIIWPEKFEIHEVDAIKKVAAAMRTGSYEDLFEDMTITVNKSTAQKMVANNKDSQETQLGFGFKDAAFTVLGHAISLGPGRVIFPKAAFKEAPSKILERIAMLSDDAPVELTFSTEEPGIVQLLQSEA